MGKRGPAPLPDSVLAARGSTVPRERERKKEKLVPVAGGGAPNPPLWMNESERAIWDALAPKLLDMGVLSEADGQALGRYCNLVSEWVEVTEKLRTLPKLVKQTNTEAPYLNPYLKLKTEIGRELQALEDRFGLTPAARMSLNVTVAFQPGYKPAAPEKPDTPKDPRAPIGGERFFRGGA